MKKLNKYFRDSFTLELYWKDKIDYRIIENDVSYEKINRTQLLKKFFTKKIRILIKKIKFS